MKISDILKPTGVPIERLTYSGKADEYITYQCYNEVGEAFAENVEIATSYYYQVDIWSKGDVVSLGNLVYSLMTAAGFYRTYALETTDTLSNGTKVNRKIYRFQYVEEHL